MTSKKAQPSFFGSSGGGWTANSSSGRSTPDGEMHCYDCGANFNIFRPKKLCHACRKHFCSRCCARDTQKRQRTCNFCRVLHSHPPVRAELMKLRVKDLQTYLASRQVNIKSCVEKKDLVELVIRENGGAPASSSSSSGAGVGAPSSSSAAAASAASASSSASGGLRGRDPIERQRSFPTAYTESTHRAEWLAKFESGKKDEDAEADDSSGSASDLVRDFVVVSPSATTAASGGTTAPDPRSRREREAADAAAAAAAASSSTNSTPATTPGGEAAAPTVSSSTSSADPPRSASSTSEEVAETPVTPFTAPDDDEEEEGEGDPGGGGGGGGSTERAREERESNRGAARSSSPTKSESNSSRLRSGDSSRLSAGGRQAPGPAAGASTASSSAATPGASPRKFANQGVVYLSEIATEEEINELSAKQMKDILAMNRVAFKGVVEKEELSKLLRRLWRQEQKAMEEKDNLEDNDLCKICMDNPVDCVMLECGHMCTCTTCGKQMNECPICRQYVVRVVKTFKS